MNYENIYNSIIEHRKLNGNTTGYVEKHHIIPRSLGGSDEQVNIVELTAREHFICHLLLIKMYKIGTIERKKMVKAFMMMKANPRDTNSRYINSRFYEKLKVEFSNIQSELMTGSGNSQYKTRWIYSITERVSKKIPVGDTTPDGWVDGRIINFDALDKECEECGKQFISKLARFCSDDCRKTSTLRKRKLNKHFLTMDTIEIRIVKGSVVENVEFIRIARKMKIPSRQILLYLGCNDSGANYKELKNLMP